MVSSGNISENIRLPSERAKVRHIQPSEHQAKLRENETETQTAERLDYERQHQVKLRENETEDDRTIRLQSKTSRYGRKKTFQSKRYLNIAKFHIVCEVTDSGVKEQLIGNMTYDCSYCNATFWEGEKLSTSTKLNSRFSFCCGEGKVVLSPLDKLPELVKISGITYAITRSLHIPNSGRCSSLHREFTSKS